MYEVWIFAFVLYALLLAKGVEIRNEGGLAGRFTVGKLIISFIVFPWFVVWEIAGFLGRVVMDRLKMIWDIPLER